MIQAILTEEFYCDGRGPELEAVRYASEGRRLQAVEYLNPDGANLKHLCFEGVQVWMFTPHEVYNWELDWADVAPGVAAVCLGKSDWLQSFAPEHLANCQHYQLKFYGEFLDVICERIVFGQETFLTV